MGHRLERLWGGGRGEALKLLLFPRVEDTFRSRWGERVKLRKGRGKREIGDWQNSGASAHLQISFVQVWLYNSGTFGSYFCHPRLSLALSLSNIRRGLYLPSARLKHSSSRKLKRTKDLNRYFYKEDRLMPADTALSITSCQENES